VSGPLWEYLDIFVMYKPGVNVYYKYLYVKTLNVSNIYKFENPKSGIT
jgi:hypothetical protein